jgi:ABC-2 type transport system permease protein
MTEMRFGIMSGFGAVLRHELRILFFAPLSYLFQVAFLLGLSVCVFLVADFYASDEATLRLLLVFMPWISLVLVPALAMSAWTDNQTDREMELTYSLPVNPAAIVIGKFVAGYLLLLLTLALTFPFGLTVAYLGDPDPGVMVAGYLACALLLGVCFSIALMAAAFVREAIGAFVTGIAGLFVLILCGWDVFGRLLRNTLPQWIWETLSVYSPVTWSNRLGEGVIRPQSLLYFGLTVSAALVITHWVIHERRRGGLYKLVSGRHLIKVMALGLFWLFAIPLASHLPGQIDLTAEKEFSLHSGTGKVLANLPGETRLTLYWSDTEDTVPASIKAHAGRIQRLLSAMSAQSNLEWTLVDPEPDTEEELEAMARGLHRVPMSSGDHFFLGLTVEHGDRLGRLPYLDIRRESLLEYDIALILNSLTRQLTPRIALISPLLPSSAALAERDGLSFMAELKRAYDLAVVPFFETTLPVDLDALILMGADILHEDMLYAIDQYVMGGGSLIVMIDPHTRVKPANNVTNPQPSDEINDISDLLARYGINYQGEGIVGDAQLASVVADDQQGRLNYPYWMRVRSAGLSSVHPTTANLNELLLVEPGALTLDSAADGTVLVTTTVDAGVYPREPFARKTPRELAMTFVGQSQSRALAAVVKGPLKSAYYSSESQGTGALHLQSSSGAPVIFVVADVDWLFDPFSLQKTRLGQDTVVRPLNDNLAFLLNMVEFATGDEALIGIRSRGKLQRPFTRVADLFRVAQAGLQEKEASLAAEVDELEQQISGLAEGTEHVEYAQLPESMKRQLEEFKSKLLSSRRELREVRRGIRAEVDGLGSRLVLINLAAGPLLVVLLAGIIFRYRKRTLERRA